MPLVDMKDVIGHAHENGYAVGAFEVMGLEFLQGIMQAAERCRAPVIVTLATPGSVPFDFDLLMPAVETAARRASVPVAIQLDRCGGFDDAVHAINRGCNGIMTDLSHLSYSENLRETAKVVAMAHGCGISVEGVLGPFSGARVAGEENGCVTVAEAKSYVERTGVDFLALTIGCDEEQSNGKAKLDYQRLKQIAEAVDVPLVVQGRAGLTDDQYRRLVLNGASQFVCLDSHSEAVGKVLKRKPGKETGGGFAGVVQDSVDAVGAEAERCMRLWGSAGRAAEVLLRCRPWRTVEHLIIYNVEDLGDGDVAAMMEEGRRVLGTIPGVRDVVCGEAVAAGAKYRYTWLVRFCHPAVIDSYRDHPLHQAFANRRFRPVAGDRISIDFQAVETSAP